MFLNDLQRQGKVQVKVDFIQNICMYPLGFKALSDSLESLWIGQQMQCDRHGINTVDFFN